MEENETHLKSIQDFSMFECDLNTNKESGINKYLQRAINRQRSIGALRSATSQNMPKTSLLSRQSTPHKYTGTPISYRNPINMKETSMNDTSEELLMHADSILNNIKKVKKNSTPLETPREEQRNVKHKYRGSKKEDKNSYSTPINKGLYHQKMGSAPQKSMKFTTSKIRPIINSSIKSRKSNSNQSTQQKMRENIVKSISVSNNMKNLNILKSKKSHKTIFPTDSKSQKSTSIDQSLSKSVIGFTKRKKTIEKNTNQLESGAKRGQRQLNIKSDTERKWEEVLVGFWNKKNNSSGDKIQGVTQISHELKDNLKQEISRIEIKTPEDKEKEIIQIINNSVKFITNELLINISELKDPSQLVINIQICFLKFIELCKQCTNVHSTEKYDKSRISIKNILSNPRPIQEHLTTFIKFFSQNNKNSEERNPVPIINFSKLKYNEEKYLRGKEMRVEYIEKECKEAMYLLYFLKCVLSFANYKLNPNSPQSKIEEVEIIPPSTNTGTNQLLTYIENIEHIPVERYNNGKFISKSKPLTPLSERITTSDLIKFPISSRNEDYDLIESLRDEYKLNKSYDVVFMSKNKVNYIYKYQPKITSNVSPTKKLISIKNQHVADNKKHRLLFDTQFNLYSPQNPELRVRTSLERLDNCSRNSQRSRSFNITKERMHRIESEMESEFQNEMNQIITRNSKDFS